MPIMDLQYIESNVQCTVPTDDIVLIRTTRRSNVGIMGATFGFRFDVYAKVLMPHLTKGSPGYRHIISTHNYQLVAETLILHSAFVHIRELYASV